MEMSTSLIVHAVTEVAVVGVLTAYLISKINANAKEIEELKAKLVEQDKHNQEMVFHINRLYSAIPPQRQPAQSSAQPAQPAQTPQPQSSFLPPSSSPPPPSFVSLSTPNTHEENLRKHATLQQSINNQMGSMLDGFMNILPVMMSAGGQSKADAVLEELNKKPTFEILDDEDDPDVAEALVSSGVASEEKKQA